MEIVKIEMSVDDVDLLIEAVKGSAMEQYDIMRLSTALEGYKNSKQFKTYDGWGKDDEEDIPTNRPKPDAGVDTEGTDEQ